MFDLTQSASASPRVHLVATDPGRLWTKDTAVAIEAPPDIDVDPRPESRWSPDAVRTGICGAVSPRVIALPNGGYRMYYSQILPRPGFPAGANDYDNATTRILSAFSADGEAWSPEPGVRLSPLLGGAEDFRVVSSEVVPVGDGRRLRMYYECCAGSQQVTNSIRSAISGDGGMEWMPEPDARWEVAGRNISAPRLVFLNDGRCRLYCVARGIGIVSAVSEDGGLAFRSEPGVRIAQDGEYDSHAAFAPEICRVVDAGYVMYYAGYGRPNRAYILRAVSEDGLTWYKELEPVLAPGPGGWDAAKCSEMCLIRLPQREDNVVRYRMFYEACDGTASDERGVWRIASATSVIRRFAAQ
ncbi:MAG: hypothetical protein FJ295_04695 [Planctomycetes bacterium]|nr:hypothetical protein [Planctomycetota bacterium]